MRRHIKFNVIYLIGVQSLSTIIHPLRKVLSLNNVNVCYIILHPGTNDKNLWIFFQSHTIHNLNENIKMKYQGQNISTQRAHIVQEHSH